MKKLVCLLLILAAPIAAAQDNVTSKVVPPCYGC